MSQIATFPPFCHPFLLLSFPSHRTMPPFSPRLFISPIFHSPSIIINSFIFLPPLTSIIMLLQLYYAAVPVWGTKLPRVSPTIAVSTLRCLREYVSSGLEENAAERLWDALWGSSGNFNMSNAAMLLSFWFLIPYLILACAGLRNFKIPCHTTSYHITSSNSWQ